MKSVYEQSQSQKRFTAIVQCAINHFITKIKSFMLDDDEFLKLIATAESFSNHPIAKAIVSSYKKDLDLQQV